MCVIGPFTRSTFIGARITQNNSCQKAMCNRYPLRELGSYILRDTLKPWQLKASGPKPTIKQFKEARKGTDPPVRGTNGLVRETDPEALLVAKV